MDHPGVPTPKPRRLSSVVLGVLGAITLVGVVLWASRLTAPSYDELDRLAAVVRAKAVVRAIAGQGLGALGAASLRSQLGAPSDEGVLGALLGAWARMSLGRVGLLDPLTSARLPWLLLASMAPLGLYWLARPSVGQSAAGLAALLLALHPAWLHAVAVTAESAWTTSIWIFVLGAYQKSIGSRVSAAQPSASSGASPRSQQSSHSRLGDALERARTITNQIRCDQGSSISALLRRRTNLRLFWALVAATLLGLGVAFSRSALWIVPILFTHHAIVHRGRVRRLVAKSEWPVPAALVIGLALAPLVAWMLTPVLWAATPLELGRWWLGPLNLAALPSELQGVGGLMRHADWVVKSTPLVTLVCLLAGLFVAVESGFPGRPAPAARCPDPRALSLLIGVGLLFTVLLPPWWPRVLSSPVPRFEACLPWLALAGGWGVHELARRWLDQRRAPWWTAAVAIAAMSSLLTSGVTTLGAERFVRAMPGDGSELGALATCIDGLGATQLTIAAPDVPSGYWQALANWERLRTDVVSGVNAAADLVLLPRLASQSSEDKSVLATVRRRGVIVWALSRR